MNATVMRPILPRRWRRGTWFSGWGRMVTAPGRRAAPGRRRPAVTDLADGRAIAATLTEQTAAAVAGLRAQGTVPGLAVLAPTADPGAAGYLRAIQRAAGRAGIDCQVHQLPGVPGAADITAQLARLSADPAVHGIVCQTPLPAGVSLAGVGQAIATGKDVDGANPASLGLVAAGQPGGVAPPPPPAARHHPRR